MDSFYPVGDYVGAGSVDAGHSSTSWSMDRTSATMDHTPYPATGSIYDRQSYSGDSPYGEDIPSPSKPSSSYSYPSTNAVSPYYSQDSASQSDSFDSIIISVDDAAHQAVADAATFSTELDGFGYITDTAIMEEMSSNRDRFDGREFEGHRDAIQSVLFGVLQQQFPTSFGARVALREAAVQLLRSMPIELAEASQICYLALVIVLQRVWGSPRGKDSGRSRTSTGKEKFPCTACDKVFGRSADLERHTENVHLEDKTKVKYLCDHKKCPRHRSPFFRRDHLRDHLRDYHKEDLPRRGLGLDDAWWESRSRSFVQNGWWRCNRCLVERVDIASNGFTCPGCGNHCEQERQRFRQRLEQS